MESERPQESPGAVDQPEAPAVNPDASLSASDAPDIVELGLHD